MIGELTLCGVDLVWSKHRTGKTPHKHRCGCFKLWSSSEVCHRCSCVACAKARADYAARLRKTSGSRSPRASVQRRKS